MAVPGVILAGGLSSRMGGGDKGLLPLGGRSLLAHVIERVGPQCAGLALNANGDPGRFAGLGLEVLPDPVPGHPGPLAGILAAMIWAEGQGAAEVLTVPGDTPFLPLDLVARLRAAGAPSVAADAALRRHPVCGLWPVAGRAALTEALAGGLRKVGVWAEGAAVVAFEGAPEPFFNVNRPEDLARAEGFLRGGGLSPGP